MNYNIIQNSCVLTIKPLYVYKYTAAGQTFGGSMVDDMVGSNVARELGNALGSRTLIIEYYNETNKTNKY